MVLSNLATSGANLASNLATSDANLASSDANLASSHDIEEHNRQIIHETVAAHIKKRMTKEQLQEVILHLCLIEHSIDEIAQVVGKNKDYIRNEIIPVMVDKGMLLPTRKRNDPHQCYLTNPKFKKPHHA